MKELKLKLGVSLCAIFLAACGAPKQEEEIVNPTKFDVSFQFEKSGAEALAFAKQDASIKLGARLNIKDVNRSIKDISKQKVKALGVCSSSQKQSEFQASENPMLLDLLPGNIFLETGERVVENCRLKLEFPQEKTSDFIWEKTIVVDLLSAIAYDLEKEVDMKTTAISFDGVYQIIADEVEDISKALMHRIQCERTSQDFMIHNNTSIGSIREEVRSWLELNQKMIAGTKCRILGLSRSGSSIFLGPLFQVYSDIDIQFEILRRDKLFFEINLSNPTISIANYSAYDVLVFLPANPLELVFRNIAHNLSPEVHRQHPEFVAPELFSKNVQGSIVVNVRANERIQMDLEYDFNKFELKNRGYRWEQQFQLPKTVEVAVSDPRVQKRFRQNYQIKDEERIKTFSIQLK